MSDPVNLEASGDVALLRIDDGKANAISPDLLKSLGAALDRAEAAEQAVVIVGRPGRFSAGFDLGTLQQGASQGRALVTQGARMALRLASFPAPVVMGCTGHALAMGAVLLAAADTRIGCRGSFKLGFNEVAIGMSIPIFLAELARDRMSKRHYLRAVVQSHIYDPEGAVDAGLLDRLVDSEQLVDAAVAECQRLAKLPRRAYARSRRTARGATLDLIEATLEADMAAAFPDS